MKLFLIHCGFYDQEISNGVYEFHVDLPVVAESTEAAKIQIQQDLAFRKKKMHIDGIQELESVDGYEIKLFNTERA